MKPPELDQFRKKCSKCGSYYDRFLEYCPHCFSTQPYSPVKPISGDIKLPITLPNRNLNKSIFESVKCGKCGTSNFRPTTCSSCGQSLITLPVVSDHRDDSLPLRLIGFLTLIILALFIGGYGLIFIFSLLKVSLLELMTTVDKTMAWVAAGVAGIVVSFIIGLITGILSEIGAKVIMKKLNVE